MCVSLTTMSYFAAKSRFLPIVVKENAHSLTTIKKLKIKGLTKRSDLLSLCTEVIVENILRWNSE